MKLKTEIVEEKQKALIVSKINYSFIKIIKKKLLERSTEVFFSSIKPQSYDHFNYLFFIDEVINPAHLPKEKLFILIQIKNKTIPSHNRSNIKVIKVNDENLNENEIEKILWFAFSKSKENSLSLNVFKKKQKEKKESAANFFYQISLKKIFFIIFVLIFITHLLFFLPLSLASYYSFRCYQAIKKNNFTLLEKLINKQSSYLNMTEKLFLKVKPTYLFFSLNTYPDNLIEINKRTGQLLKNTLSLKKIGQKLFGLIFKKNQNEEEKKIIELSLNTLEKQINQLEKDLSIINANPLLNFKPLSQIKKKLFDLLDLVSQFKQTVPFVKEVLAKNTEKNYLLLFANNMELRPGGGFIGSFGTLRFKDLSLQSLKIYDVYDADGQLKAHIEPPEPIRKYLNQPHWFLRDSAFSPDFFENYLQAKSFLAKEMELNNFNGAVLLTTSAIENFLDAFGNIYLPDYHETINRKNFYIKTQYYTEKNFFPGSAQKKNFLSSLTNQLLINLENSSLEKLLFILKKALDEKQIVIYFDQPGELQKIIEKRFWAGRVIEPICLNNYENCVVNYLLPVDANLGVNKSNFFVNRSLNIKVFFDKQGKISHQISISFKNESSLDGFLGGDYKNYFQMYLPIESKITTVNINGVAVDKEVIDNEVINEKIKRIGFFVVVPKKRTMELKLSYVLNQEFKKGRGIYQLIIQKQIGSFNNDLVLEIYLPKNYYLLNQNFIPLVKDNQIIYNTNLSADKIFVIELIKD